MNLHKPDCRLLIGTLILFLGISVQISVPVNAHEYWIAPLDFTPELNGRALADLRVGEDFKGDALAYIGVFTVGYQVTDSSGTRELKGRDGDRPALSFETLVPGLHIMSYQTTQNRVRFDEWETFATYINNQGIPETAERHRERNLPPTGFSELYSRYAKSLLAVGGESTGADREIGMRTELTALANPYSLPFGEPLPVQLFYEGAPLPDKQISIFTRSQKPGEEDFLETSKVRTDENGRALIKVMPGRRYMLNSVHLTEVEGRGEVVYESFWASLTFEVP